MSELLHLVVDIRQAISIQYLQQDKTTSCNYVGIISPSSNTIIIETLYFALMLAYFDVDIVHIVSISTGKCRSTTQLLKHFTFYKMSVFYFDPNPRFIQNKHCTFNLLLKEQCKYSVVWTACHTNILSPKIEFNAVYYDYDFTIVKHHSHRGIVLHRSMLSYLVDLLVVEHFTFYKESICILRRYLVGVFF